MSLPSQLSHVRVGLFSRLNNAGQFFLLTNVLMFAGCRQEQTPAANQPNQPSSQAIMTAMLQIISQQSHVNDMSFQDATITQTQKELDAVDAEKNPVAAFNLHRQLASDFRRLGRDQEAVAETDLAIVLNDQHSLLTTDASRAEFFYDAGLTWLRLGENSNCVHCRTGDSCILPISEKGQHLQKQGSTEAIKYFLQCLAIEPDNLNALWLLNIASMTIGSYPDGVPTQFRIPPERFESKVPFPRFIDVAASVGLKTTNCSGCTVTDDFDNDGYIDLMTASWNPQEYIRLFKNDAKGKFDDISDASGIGTLAGGLNAVQGDFNNDGLIDVYMTRGAWLRQVGRKPNSLLRNLGNGKFEDITFALGIGNMLAPTSSAAWADMDNDGDLDLFVGNEEMPCQLFRNDGSSGFVDIAPSANVTNNSRFTKAVVWGDFNNDRLPDIYVSNYKSENRLYRNDGNGKFTDIAQTADVTKPISSFPTWFWDVNNDGNLDIFCASYEMDTNIIVADFLNHPQVYETDKLYLGDGTGNFIDRTAEFALDAPTAPMGSNFGDLDNDGFPDFYLGTGFPDFGALMPNLMFHNVGGKKFDNVTYAGGFGHLQKGHATSFVDLDNDGDQDVFIQMGGAYKGDAFGDVLFENPGFGNHFLRVTLVGVKSNRSAIGARIRADIIEQGKPRSVYSWVNSGGSFGARPLMQHLGLGAANRVERLEIYWPASDTRQTFDAVTSDQQIEIAEFSAELKSLPLKTFQFAR